MARGKLPAPGAPRHQRTHELDDAAAAADLLPTRACRAPPRRAGSGVAARRRRHPPHELQGAGVAIAPHGQGLGRIGCEAGADGGHAGLERLPPHGAVLRGVGQRRGAAHAEPAPAPRPGGVHRRPCRGPGAVLRHELPAADRSRGLAREDDQALRRHDRSRAHAGELESAEAAVLRGAARRAGRPLRLAAVRREHRQLAVLHLGHHRQPEGRAVQPPLDLAARAGRGHAGCTELLGRRHHPAGGADVPRQRLEPALCGLHGRRQAGVSRRRAGRQVAVRTVRSREGHACRPACPRCGRGCWLMSRRTS